MHKSYKSVKCWSCCTLASLIAACADTAPRTIASVPTPAAQWGSRVDTLPGTYTLLGSVAEVASGVLVTTDIKENIVWRVDVAVGTRRELGSKGDGPGEYYSPGEAVNIGHDSVALLDATEAKFPVISAHTGRGRTHVLRHRFAPGVASAGASSAGEPWLQYADTLGHLYGAPYTTAPKTNPQTGRRDVLTAHALASIPVVRYSLSTGVVDTLEHFARGVPVVETKRDGNARIRGMDMGPYGAFNSWIVTSGGRLIIADAAHYTLTVTDAAVSNAPIAQWTVAGNVIPVSASTWKRYVDQATRDGDAQAARITASVLSRIGAQSPGTLHPTRYVVPDKPRVLPYLRFENGKLHMHEADGVVWVPVHVSGPPGAEHWDLIDLATGKRLETVVFPANQYLQHVSPRGAYVVTYDDDDVGRLLLYRRRGYSFSASFCSTSARSGVTVRT